MNKRGVEWGDRGNESGGSGRRRRRRRRRNGDVDQPTDKANIEQFASGKRKAEIYNSLGLKMNIVTKDKCCAFQFNTVDQSKKTILFHCFDWTAIKEDEGDVSVLSAFWQVRYQTCFSSSSKC